MLEQIKLLTSRRAYEFRPDDVRLSTLSIKPMQEQIQQLFHFQTSVMGSPMPTFGDVPATYPPGFVFDMGVWISEDKQIIPIRFLHFEQRRIVIDVAGPSSAIDAIFAQLQHFLSQMQAADGTPIIGEPERMLDYSEFTAQFPFSLEAIFAPPLRKLLTRVIGADVGNQELALVPMMILQRQPRGQEFAGIAGTNDTRSFTFTQRAGTRPEERIYFSGAPLNSEAHLAYLTELEESLNPSGM